MGSRIQSETVSDDLIPDLTASSPKTIWIELTSKCPFDCIFCSRKHERGSGQHMNFALYESLIRQLQQPEVIRLNYSGESLHYPQLPDAIRLARRTGATTELVSALGSATQAALESLVDASLHRLSVSIHSMDSAQFRTIYRHGEISDIRERLEYLQHYKSRRGSKYPEIDFAFVAMHENLSQLRSVVEYASALGVTHVSVHPVIHRGTSPLRFPREIDDAGMLRGEFVARVRGEVATVSSRQRGISIAIARPDRVNLEPPGGITTCEQNPWDTVHVLADGRVVVCEVQDRVEIGNLQRQTLAEIWNGPKYQSFRQQYLNGANGACLACPWRKTITPSTIKKVLVRGWHPSGGETVEWSEANAALAVAVHPGVTGIRLSGMLPPPLSGSDHNLLSIRRGTGTVTHIVNETEDLAPFETVVPITARQVHTAVLQFETKHRFCPAERGHGPDLRNLGFALTDLALEYDERRCETVSRLLDLLEHVERIAILQRATRWMIPRSSMSVRPGVSVVLPARDTPELLASALATAEAAIAQVDEPTEIIVVISGAESSAYAGLRRRFPGVTWISRSKVLHYVEAVEAGLIQAKYPWLYLLNSDMRLEPNALTEVMKLRCGDSFAIATRIRMQDGSRTETNWTDLRYCEGDAAELIERDPADVCEPRGSLYVGGGSGLFRASLLRRFIKRTRVYAPFYWEDVEWGCLAWRYGYKSVFCPTSEAIHGHRQTIARYYNEREVSRVFERNRLLFHLRNLSGLRRLEKRLWSLDPQSWADIFQPAVLFNTAWARAMAFIAPLKEDVLQDRWKIPF